MGGGRGRKKGRHSRGRSAYKDPSDCARSICMRRKTGAVGQFAANVGHKRAHRVEIRIINMAEVKSSTACLYGWPYHGPFPYREKEEDEREGERRHFTRTPLIIGTLAARFTYNLHFTYSSFDEKVDRRASLLRYEYPEYFYILYNSINISIFYMYTFSKLDWFLFL